MKISVTFWSNGIPNSALLSHLKKYLSEHISKLKLIEKKQKGLPQITRSQGYAFQVASQSQIPIS